MVSPPQVFNVLRGEAAHRRGTPYGEVGELFSAEGLEVVWVSKQDEEKDPEWFSQKTVDLLLVVQGLMRVEFADPELGELTLEPGDLLVLPPGMKCRAFRWPRDAAEATIFVAASPST